MNIFFEYEDFADIFGGSSQNWTRILGSFLKVNVQNILGGY